MKVLFDIPKQSVCIEGDGPDLIKLLEVVREVAPKLPHITIQANEPAKTPDKPSGNGGNGEGGVGETVRQFTRKIPLTSNSEKIAAIAYYKNDAEEVDTFTPSEMGQWFTICGFKKPTQMSVTVHDARKRYGYVESVGHGRWRLTTNGLNLIVGKLNEAIEEE